MPRLLPPICLALLLTLSPLRAAQTTPCDPNRFGVVDQLQWDWLYSPDQIEQALTLMNEAGITWLRLNWAWKEVQDVPGPFDYTNHDRVAQMAAEHDIQLLPILMGIPAWASTAPEELKRERGSMSPVDRYRPPTLDDWIVYIRNMVERYDGDGTDDAPGSPRLTHWEVWNEPNLAFYWPPAPNAAEYAALLATTAATIREADPTATVVLGGLSGSGVNAEGTGFLQQLYDLNVAASFDVVSVHLYVHPSLGSIDQLTSALESTRRVMDEHGDVDKPLWLTEIGWSTAPDTWGLPTVTQDEVAGWLTEVYTATLPVERIFWYNFRDQEPASLNVEHNFGLVNWDLTPKPTYHAYAVTTACR